MTKLPSLKNLVSPSFLLVVVFTLLPLAFSSRVLAATISTLTVAPTSSTLGATTSYTITATLPTALPAPGGFIAISMYNDAGDPSQGYSNNLTSATLGSGTTIAGSINRSGGMANWSTGIMLSAPIAAGSSITIVLNNVVNASFRGRYALELRTNAMGTEIDLGKTYFYLGVSASKTISGYVRYREDGTGVSTAQLNIFPAQVQGGGGGINANVNADGSYTVTIWGGKWQLNLSPQRNQNGQQVAVDWAYSSQGPPPSVSFKDDASVETATVNFTVVKATGRVYGRLVYPNGDPVTRGGVDIRSEEGSGNGGGLEPDGRFSVMVPGGTYTFSAFLDDQTVTAPNLPSFTVAASSSVNLGTITLVSRNEFVRGRVIDRGGNGIAGVRINAWRPQGGGWAQAVSAADGSYQLALTQGTWEIMPQPDPSIPYTFEAGGPPLRVSLSANQVVSNINFTLTLADAVITGNVIDANGVPQTEMFGWVMAMKGTGDPPMPGPGTDLRGGYFTLRVPAGAWMVNIMMPPNSNFTSSGGVSVSVDSGQTKNISLRVRQVDAWITGYIRDNRGALVTGQRVEVFAHNGAGSFKNAQVDSASGSYRLGVIGGFSWFLGVFVEPSSGYMMIPPDDNKVTVAVGQTATRDFTLLRADTTISGIVLDPSGNPLPNVFVFADTKAGETTPSPGAGLHTGGLVGPDGRFTLQVPAGTWGVGSGAPPSLGYMNPEVQRVTLAAGATASVTLRYKASDGRISGRITLNGVASPAFVWAWSETGGHSETMSFGGEYTLNVTKNETWHVGADYESSGTLYRSSEFIVPVGSSGTASQNLTLTQAPFTLPSAVSQTFSASAPTTITLSNGMVISIPAEALGSSGNVTVTVTPTSQLAKQLGQRPIAFGYEIKAYNSSGQEITSTFNSDVTIVIPYTEAMLADLGITEAGLGAAYFDSNSSLWQGITSYLVDRVNNTVTITVNHFTPFALTTGSADTTPPSNPTNVTVSNQGGGVVRISWTNPTDSDFNHVNIYRSTTLGALGDRVTSTTSSSTTSYDDSGLSVGTYHYSLKAADATGNLSSGTSQVTITLTSVTATTTPTPTPTPQALPATGVPLATAVEFYLRGIFVLLGSFFGLLSSRILLLRRLG